MRAKDVMSTPAITVTRRTPVKEAAELLVRHRISALPVVDSDGNLIGIVSESDLVPLELTPDPRERVIRTFTPASPRTVAELMTEEVVALPENADIAWIAELMWKKHLKHIPIVSGERVVGIVSRRDLMRIVARSDEEIRAELQTILDKEAHGLGTFTAEVSRGVVMLTGPSDRLSRRAVALLARSVPGVLDVRFGNAA